MIIYASLQKSSEVWFCTKCVAENLPFGLTASPLNFNKSLSSVEIKEFLAELNSLEFDEAITETMSGVNCKYYDANDFSNLDSGSNNFSLFHLNIAFLSKHFDELRVLLGQLGHGFNIIGITETGFQNNIPLTNCDLPGYNYAHTPTKGVKGGALLYISDNLQYTERVDLDSIAYKDKELESKFIEIIQTDDKNIIVGCIYRHPSMSVNEFNNDYLTPLLDKASSENKLIFLTGDFNVDLLKADTNKDFAEYLDNLSSYDFHPHIILPTRVTDISSTVIDNIFFNSIEYNIVSGNLTSSISDHFPQFLLARKMAYSKYCFASQLKKLLLLSMIGLSFVLMIFLKILETLTGMLFCILMQMTPAYLLIFFSTLLNVFWINRLL